QHFTIPAPVDIKLPGPDPNPAWTKCTVQPTEPIKSRWVSLFGVLGCPLGPELPIPGRQGHSIAFVHGQVVSSPEQGTNLTVAVYQREEDINVVWGDTAPYSYDKFLLRLRYNGIDLGQIETGGGSSGTFAFHNNLRKDDAPTTPIAGAGAGPYEVIIEG